MYRYIQLAKVTLLIVHKHVFDLLNSIVAEIYFSLLLKLNALFLRLYSILSDFYITFHANVADLFLRHWALAVPSASCSIRTGVPEHRP